MLEDDLEYLKNKGQKLDNNLIDGYFKKYFPYGIIDYDKSSLFKELEKSRTIIKAEDRLIQFSVDIILMCNKIEKSFTSEHLAKQLIRSATSSALNYGEARSGESTNDFLHKMKICLKELRESFINLKIHSSK